MFLNLVILYSVHKNQHILSSTKRKSELSIIYQNCPIFLMFSLKIIGILMVYLTNWIDLEFVGPIICMEYMSLGEIFPMTYTVANFRRIREYLLCCWKSKISINQVEPMTTIPNS
ncbi:unnamed protein product [Caenorhabditis angaria]|uniref:Uncharacterized protein n=1 Tax=Caenorhabditis angaria TaxID=860376 RepID=A0A9P1MU59_9PELO|nr:unnamed protein product [Caenorhabditis angaria]